MFKVRLISGIFLLLILFIALFYGPIILYPLAYFIGMSGLYEYQKALNKGTWQLSSLNIWGFVATSLLFGSLYFQRQGYLIFVGVLYFISLLVIYVFSYPRYHHKQVAEAAFGFLYVPVMILFLCLTQSLPNGKVWVWFIPICSWGSDTFAYCVGMLMGRHKMSPILSPKKSIEGAVGGMLGSGFLALFLGYWQFGHSIQWIKIAPIMFGIGVIGAFLSMIGDLVASGIKREYEIKDYGRLIPGHGGILDRFDSMLMISPIIFWLCYLLIGEVL